MAVNADPPARTAKPAQFGLVYLLGVVTILAAAMMPPAYWGWSWRRCDRKYLGAWRWVRGDSSASYLG